MRLATRLFVASGLIILATLVGLVSAADGYLRRGLEVETADELERDARLIAALLLPDSTAWPEEARRLGAIIGRRITLVDSAGRVRGDTEFDRASLPRLQNHGTRPEIVAARRRLEEEKRRSEKLRSLLGRGVERLDSGEFAEARVAFEAALDLDPTSAEGVEGIARANAGLAWLASEALRFAQVTELVREGSELLSRGDAEMAAAPAKCASLSPDVHESP